MRYMTLQKSLLYADLMLIYLKEIFCNIINAFTFDHCILYE